MSPLWFIVGALIGCALVHLAHIIFSTEWRPRRCKRGKPCGCQTIRNGYGIYRVCDNSFAKEGKPSV